jgi:putative redox protein
MKNQNLEFTNQDGHQLSARLALPATERPHNYAIFAHCFTCNKNLKAVQNISLALTGLGFGVLSFDFTGLGKSKGEFEDTNFSSNVDDLLAAAEFLKNNYRAPTLLIGHSLGGAAVIFASAKIDSVKAIATIGAPAYPEHAMHLLDEDLETIRSKGEARVNIGGRPFTIKKQFIDDLMAHGEEEVLKKSRKALLILHSPQDSVVSIDNAALLYQAAHHPKSFISLDGADHLMSKKEDSVYAGQIIAGWSERYLEKSEPESVESEHQTVVRLDKDSGKFTTRIKAGKHYLVADEPEDIGGDDLGPSPYQLLSAALGACTAMTIRMYADQKGWPLEEVIVHLNHFRKYADDCQDSEQEKSKIDHIDRHLEFTGELDEKQRKRLLEIANKCPVHKTLSSEIKMQTFLDE